MKPIRPIVKVPNSSRTRDGRGFSLGELKEAGLTVEKARALGIYIDKRRKSVHEENVKVLRKLLS